MKYRIQITFIDGTEDIYNCNEISVTEYAIQVGTNSWSVIIPWHRIHRYLREIIIEE